MLNICKSIFTGGYPLIQSISKFKTWLELKFFLFRKVNKNYFALFSEIFKKLATVYVDPYGK